MLKKIGIIALSATMLAGGILPSISHASSVESEQIAEGIIDIISSDMLVNDTLLDVSSTTESFNDVDFSDIGTVETVGEDTILTITDAEFIEACERAGIEISTEELSQARANGTTKIVWSGAAKNGNVKLYLSKLTLVTIQGLKVAAAMVTFIVNLYFANYIGAATTMVKAVVNTVKAGSINHGRVYTVKSWKYQGYANQ